MQQPTLAQAIEKRARAGEQAGIGVEDMIQILNAGVSVEILLDLLGLSLWVSLERNGGSFGWIT
jgi:hypothetical protein